jgi:glutamine amidotransferase
MISVAVLDYGGSNLLSVAKALEHVGDRKHRITITQDPVELRAADRVVFPGQGAIGACMKNLAAMGLDAALPDIIQSKPFLGICLGLQTLMELSDEDGSTPALGVIPGQVVHFPDRGDRDPSTGLALKIPHMGWNQVARTREHPLWQGIDTSAWFYFVHSYYVVPDNAETIAGETDYGVAFTSVVARDNIFATQFHPEKSQRPGLTILRNFLAWSP